MKTHIAGEERLDMDSLVQMAGSDIDMLVRCGFSREEIAARLWLRQWYQTGGSDRVQIVRHLEFLKLLVLRGKVALSVWHEITSHLAARRSPRHIEPG